MRHSHVETIFPHACLRCSISDTPCLMSATPARHRPSRWPEASRYRHYADAGFSDGSAHQAGHRHSRTLQRQRGLWRAARLVTAHSLTVLMWRRVKLWVLRGGISFLLRAATSLQMLMALYSCSSSCVWPTYVALLGYDVALFFLLRNANVFSISATPLWVPFATVPI